MRIQQAYFGTIYKSQGVTLAHWKQGDLKDRLRHQALQQDADTLQRPLNASENMTWEFAGSMLSGSKDDMNIWLVTNVGGDVDTIKRLMLESLTIEKGQPTSAPRPGYFERLHEIARKWLDETKPPVVILDAEKLYQSQ